MDRHRALVICKSVHHHNTARVARVIADVLSADICAPEDVPWSRLNEYDLIGLGSGIYFGRFHSTLRRWVRGMPPASRPGRAAFLFSTSGLPWLWRLYHRPLRAQLLKRGYNVVAEFHCAGYDTFGPLCLIGGIHRRHPDERDLQRAADFAREELLPTQTN